ncbi:MAG TPA: peptidylprolyl isomerase [Ramlibacter sp.]|nr:peptidylprolyl isomerase [Ramlibacter sp.]
MSTASGCGGGGCACGGGAQAGSGVETMTPVATVNGITLHAAGQAPDETELRELAWAELLRQEAVRQGLLARHPAVEAPALSPADREVIEAMLERSVPVPQPTDDECRRYYEARQDRYVEGRLAHVRHILFAVTNGVNVHALAARAEQALLELSRKDADPGRFATLARELSNCPSGAEGGDLGWIGPHDCADELANELFPQKSPSSGVGLRPRLVHTRYGFHIVEVLGRKQGRQLAFDEVRARIGVQLAQQSRAKALHQYIQLLAGQAVVEGVSLEGADSPLVQ